MNIQFTDFAKLRESVRKYGIFDFAKQIATRRQIRKLEKEGLDIKESDIFSTNAGELFVILENGSIKKAIIHIVEISNWNENWNYPKIHIYFCKMIEKMQNAGKEKRYKASSRKDGKFYLIKNKKEWNEALEICSYCHTQYKNQFKSHKTRKNFNLKEWIENPISDPKFSKVELDHCTVPNCYTKKWPQISKMIRKQVNYICQACKKDFSSEECKEFLHVHHKDSDKTNNTTENLIPLCIECHSAEYNHGHIKQQLMYKKWQKSKCFKIVKNRGF